MTKTETAPKRYIHSPFHSSVKFPEELGGCGKEHEAVGDLIDCEICLPVAVEHGYAITTSEERKEDTVKNSEFERRVQAEVEKRVDAIVDERLREAMIDAGLLEAKTEDENGKNVGKKEKV